MKALVAYESQTGHTKQAAQAVAEAVRGLGGEAVVKNVRRVAAEDVQAADVLFVGTWAHGLFVINVHPAGAKEWVAEFPPLTDKPAGVFCTYLLTPGSLLKQLGKMLEGRGAAVKGERKFHRSRPTEGAEAFVRGVVEAAGLLPR